MARLLVEFRGERRELPITGPVTIGRSKSATIHIDDLQLSREHTRLFSDGTDFFVQDLESKNGTFLNGVLVRKLPEKIKTGDRIKIGPAYLTFFQRDRDDDRATMVAPAPKPATQRAAAPTATAPTAPVAARARPRRAEEVEASAGMNPALLFLVNLFLFGVLIGGSFVFKNIFVSVLSRIPQ